MKEKWLLNIFLFKEWLRDVFIEYISIENLSLYLKILNYYLKSINKVLKYLKYDKRELLIFVWKDVKKIDILLKLFNFYINWDYWLIKEIGFLLDYPKCCVSQFYEFFKRISPYDFKFYYFYYFDIIRYNSKKFYKLLNIFSDNRLIFHTPCRFDCTNSIYLAQKYIRVIKTNDLLKKNIKKLWYIDKVILKDTNEYFCYTNGQIVEKWVYYEYNPKWNRYKKQIYKFE